MLIPAQDLRRLKTKLRRNRDSKRPSAGLVIDTAMLEGMVDDLLREGPGMWKEIDPETFTMWVDRGSIGEGGAIIRHSASHDGEFGTAMVYVSMTFEAWKELWNGGDK